MTGDVIVSVAVGVSGVHGRGDVSADVLDSATLWRRVLELKRACVVVGFMVQKQTKCKI